MTQREEPWVRVRVGMPRHAKVAGLSSDGARWAYVVALCEAKATEGVYPSLGALRVALGLWARHSKELLASGLLELEPDTGCVVVHDWDEHQSLTDTGAAERMRRYRERQRAARVTPQEAHAAPPVTPPVTPERYVTPLAREETRDERVSSASLRSLRARETVTADELRRDGLLSLQPEGVQELEQLTGMLATQASHKVMGDLDLLVQRHGQGPVLEAARAVRSTYNGTPPSWPQLVYGSRNVLEPLPSGRQQQEATQAGTAALEERRKARAQVRHMAYLRGDITEAEFQRLRELDLLPGEEKRA